MTMKRQVVNGITFYVPQNPVRLNGGGPNGIISVPVDFAKDVRLLHGKTTWKGGDDREKYTLADGLGLLTVSFKDNNGTTMKGVWPWPAPARALVQSGFALNGLNAKGEVKMVFLSQQPFAPPSRAMAVPQPLATAVIIPH
jgi:hypothetical protein